MVMQISAGNQYLPRTGEKILEEGNKRANVLDTLANHYDMTLGKETGDDVRAAAALAVKMQMQQQALAAKASIAASRGATGDAVTEAGEDGTYYMPAAAYSAMALKALTQPAPGLPPGTMPVTPVSRQTDKRGRPVGYYVKPNAGYRAPLNNAYHDPAQADDVAANTGLGMPK